MRYLLLLLLLAAPALAVSAGEVAFTYQQGIDSLFAGNLDAAKSSFTTISQFDASYPDLAETAANMVVFIDEMVPCTGTKFVANWNCIGQVEKEDGLATTQLYSDSVGNSVHYTKIGDLIDVEDMKRRLTERGMTLTQETLRDNSGYTSDYMVDADIGVSQKVSFWTDASSSYLVYETAKPALKEQIHNSVATGKVYGSGTSGSGFNLLYLAGGLGLVGLVGFFVLKKKNSAPSG